METPIVFPPEAAAAPEAAGLAASFTTVVDDLSSACEHAARPAVNTTTTSER